MSKSTETHHPTLGLILLSLGKFGLAVLVVVFIAFGFLIFSSPTGDVAEAEADIWDLFPSQSTKNQKFTKTLEREGMSKPRQFDHNGNQVFFSHMTTRQSPREVMLRFQEAFVREGVNTHFHNTARVPVDPGEVEDLDTIVQGLAGADEFFSGGLVPMMVTRNHMYMVGIDTPEKAENIDDAIIESRIGAVTPPEIVGAFRYLDANREEGSLQTTVTAVWSDEHFDLRKLSTLSQTQGTVHQIEFEVPICQGCSRVTRLSGTGRESNRHTILYRSPHSVNAVISFYENHMMRYGWETDPSTRSLAELHRRELAPQDISQVRAYLRDDQRLTLAVYRDYVDGFTYARIMID